MSSKDNNWGVYISDLSFVVGSFYRVDLNQKYEYYNISIEPFDSGHNQIIIRNTPIYIIALDNLLKRGTNKHYFNAEEYLKVLFKGRVSYLLTRIIPFVDAYNITLIS